LFALADVLIALLDGLQLPVDVLFLLLHAPFDAIDFLPPVSKFAIQLRAEPHRFVLRLDSSRSFSFFGVSHNLLGFTLSHADS
jgi:hypothetical protein